MSEYAWEIKIYAVSCPFSTWTGEPHGKKKCIKQPHTIDNTLGIQPMPICCEEKCSIKISTNTPTEDCSDCEANI